jgi:anti-anti-sigma factor
MSSSPALPSFSVTPVPQRERVTLVAVGELDLSCSDQLAREFGDLLDVGWTDVTIDLREIDFADTAGLHVLLEARARATAAGATLRIAVAPGPVTELLELTGTEALVAG